MVISTDGISDKRYIGKDLLRTFATNRKNVKSVGRGGTDYIGYKISAEAGIADIDMPSLVISQFIPQGKNNNLIVNISNLILFISRGPGGFYLPRNETRYDPMYFDIEVI